MKRKLIASSIQQGKQELPIKGTITKLIKSLDLEKETLDKASSILNGKNSLWDIANLIGNYYNDKNLSPEKTEICKEIIEKIRDFQGDKAAKSVEPTTVVFGTSGWRGVIGEDFTTLNVHKVTRSIIDMMKSDEFLNTNGYKTFKDVQEKGIVVFRDNRFMGDEFMNAAMKELAAAGIKIHFSGECPTGVGSAIVTELGAAGSLNFTPSHNPMNYAGLKFNPADGGPADKNLTDLIMAESIDYMKDGTEFTPATAEYKYETVNNSEVFKTFMSKSKIFALEETKAWLSEVKEDLFIAVDNMHGASRGLIQEMLGKELMEELEASGSIVFINTNEDYSFHGVKPEPSAKNQKPIIELAKKSGRKLTFVGALDPDADRIRFGTANMDIDMNKFGAIAYGNLIDRGMRGPVASTAPSSDFALKIAKDNDQEVIETAVGFKYFRPHRTALVAFEESDGFSTMGHTLEKDALAGFFMALDVMRTTGKNLDEYFAELQEKYGYYICDKIGVDVEGVSVDEWQDYKGKVVNVLQHQMYNIGDQIKVGDENKTIANINIIDGLKVIFEDGSWILARPSGTEPKFRIYGEVTSKTKPTKEQEEKMLNDIFEAGKGILAGAREIVDSGKIDNDSTGESSTHEALLEAACSIHGISYSELMEEIKDIDNKNQNIAKLLKELDGDSLTEVEDAINFIVAEHVLKQACLKNSISFDKVMKEIADIDKQNKNTAELLRRVAKSPEELERIEGAIISLTQ